MAISKRLRYEILRRDNHQCRYCGGTAPDVKLTVDHIVPVSLGGSDAPENLVAACRDCNAGKASSNPDAPLVDTVADDALRWAAAMRQARDERALADARLGKILDAFDEAWSAWHFTQSGNEVPRPQDWRATVENVLTAGLTIDEVIDLIPVAMVARAKDTWKYFCGCCWNRVRRLQDRASEIVGESSPPASVRLETRWTDAQARSYAHNVRQNVKAMGLDPDSTQLHCPHVDTGHCGDAVCAVAHVSELAWYAVDWSDRSKRADKVMDELDRLEFVDG